MIIKDNDKMWCYSKLAIIKILHMIIEMIHNAKEEDILGTLKIKKIKMKLTLIVMKILL